MPEIISRDEAKRLGLKRFYTGSPCQKGHLAERKVANKTCVVCCRVHFSSFYEKNRTRLITNKLAWYKENPEYAREARNKRRSLQRASGGTYSKQEILNLFAYQCGKCANCLKPMQAYHIDHVMPLSLGGSNDRSNLQLLCPKCNQHKSNKDPLDWAQQNGRLL